MLSYSAIIRQAYHITIKNPILWLFGLFVAGGFNLDFLQYQNIPARQIGQSISLKDLVAFLGSHPGALATLSLSLLIFSLLGLLVTNWCRVMLVLVVNNLLVNKRLVPARQGGTPFSEQLAKGRKTLWPVIKISLTTSFLIVVAALGLFVPPLFITSNPQVQVLLWALAAVLFLPILFAVSSANIFTTYFIILFGQKLKAALNLGTDFFLSRWTEILGLVVALGAVYLVGFFVGVSIIYLLKVVFRWFFEEFTVLSFSATIWIPNVVANVLIWLLLGLLNAFINTALLLLFLKLVTPVEHEDKVVDSVHPLTTPAGI